MTDSVKFSLTKLNDTNYSVWSYRMKLYLSKEGVWKQIINEPPSPVTDEWTNSKDAKAQSLIALAIEDNQIKHIKKEDTAKGM